MGAAELQACARSGAVQLSMELLYDAQQRQRQQGQEVCQSLSRLPVQLLEAFSSDPQQASLLLNQGAVALLGTTLRLSVGQNVAAHSCAALHGLVSARDGACWRHAFETPSVIYCWLPSRACVVP